MKTIKGTNGPDRLIGGAQSDLILGLGDSDTIRAGSASFSILNGGNGDDVIYSGKANDDLLIGGNGDDEFHLGKGRVSAYGGKGNDNVLVGTGDEFLIGGAGQDTLSGLGARSSYSISTDADGYTHLINGAGVEIVEQGFETLAFAPEPTGANTPTNNSINPPSNNSVNPAPVTTPPASGGGGGGGGGTPPAPKSTYTNGAAGDLNENGTLMFGTNTTPGDQNYARQASNQVYTPAVDFGVFPRQEVGSDAYSPTSHSTSGNITTSTYDVPAGTQSVTNGSQADDPTQDATDFVFGFEANTLQQALAAGDKFNISATSDAGAGLNYTGTLVADPNMADHFIIQGTGASAGIDITDNGGNSKGSFNAEQLRFFDGFAHPAADDTLQVNLDVLSKTGTELAGLHNTVNYVGGASGNDLMVA